MDGMIPNGTEVVVYFRGRIAGRSDFENGGESYLIEHTRKGKTVREWVVADKVSLAAVEQAAAETKERKDG
ncbi:hypothetical protein ACFPOD_05105 [Nitratireductor kimnyeongensis]|uniref:SnoaL-like polyketide cyclase n=1 Tax=Nitratireductor kimnyeongensis TaxID=430679 RepID=A0ABW0T596_9HYPH|nr:hypothetical protein [Nitratireductor kimnyeongensis]QZZ34539.1 hypothetical protein KW403_12095 [Nitratireductor kimnyeongensis]